MKRVVVAINTRHTKKKWDLGRGKSVNPDITLCQTSNKKQVCLPRNKSGARAATPTKAICKDSQSCYIGCDYRNRIYVSPSKSASIALWDVDRVRHDLMFDGKCRFDRNTKARCGNKKVALEFFPYDARWCKKKKREEKQGRNRMGVY